MNNKTPSVQIAVIGGSAILGSGFPHDFKDVEVLNDDIRFKTPFGPTAPFTHAQIDGEGFLFVPFHGITKEIGNTEPNSAGERAFYALFKAEVKKIIGCALCGSTNRLLDPADIVVPNGFVDLTTKRAQSLFRNLRAKGIETETISYRLNQPFCPTLSHLLVQGSKKAGFPRVFSRGIVGVAEGPRLESPSEIKLRYTNQGIDIVTMNLVPEVFFSREIGSCYAALELVSNYGEGMISTEWSGPETFIDFQKKWSRPAAEAIIYALKKIDPNDNHCGCSRFRWSSIIS